jgi:hypothetical protein
LFSVARPIRLVFVLTALVLPAAARGEDDDPRAAPAPERVNLQPDTASAEVARMAAVLDSQVGTARLWYWGWSGFFGAVMTVGTVTNATTTGGAQEAAQVNIASSAVYLFATLVNPPPVAFDWEPIGKMPESTPERRAAKSEAIRALFAREVSKERSYRSVWTQILGLAVNAGVSAYMYWGLHIGGRALLNLVAGSVIWEAKCFTSPTAASHLEAELQGTGSLQLQIAPIALGPAGAGVAVVGRF